MAGVPKKPIDNTVTPAHHTHPMPHYPPTASAAEIADREQPILNAHPIPPRHLQRDLWPQPAVRVRIVWETDGEETIETVAVAWHRDSVLVRIMDDRRRTVGVWVGAGDVARV